MKSGPVSWTWGESVFFHIFLKRFSLDVVLNLLLHISKAHETFEMMQVISDPSFEYNFTRASYSPVWNYFCCCWYYKRTIDSPEPIRSAMMFGTDWIGPSFKGLGPGLQLLTCWWSNRIIISSKRYYHLKIEIKISI